jgi:hypothetical protein
VQIKNVLPTASQGALNQSSRYTGTHVQSIHPCEEIYSKPDFQEMQEQNIAKITLQRLTPISKNRSLTKTAFQ